MQLEIVHLRIRLRRKQHRGTISSSDPSFDDDSDNNYHPWSRTSPNESFLCDQDRHYRWRKESPSRQCLGNDAMGRVLNQISKSHFTRIIEGGKLPWWFTQPTFIMYNGRMDPIEHVSHFNQRMTIYSKNEALMCKVFPIQFGACGNEMVRRFEGRFY